MVTRGRAEVKREIAMFFLRIRKESIGDSGNDQVLAAESRDIR